MFETQLLVGLRPLQFTLSLVVHFLLLIVELLNDDLERSHVLVRVHAHCLLEHLKVLISQSDLARVVFIQFAQRQQDPVVAVERLVALEPPAHPLEVPTHDSLHLFVLLGHLVSALYLVGAGEVDASLDLDPVSLAHIVHGDEHLRDLDVGPLCRQLLLARLRNVANLFAQLEHDGLEELVGFLVAEAVRVQVAPLLFCDGVLLEQLILQLLADLLEGHFRA